MKILTLNLHTYQELPFEKEDTLGSFLKKYRPIQETIANFIAEKDIDFAFFQEVGQYIDDVSDIELYSVSIKKSNYVRILSEILSEKGRNYYFTWDVSHYGFGVWEEGLGILSKYPIVEFEGRYVSRKHDLNTFYSRKIIRARAYVGNNTTDLYCVHFNWKEEGFADEFLNVVKWLEEVGNEDFVIAGDFNVPYGSAEYELVINTKVLGKRLIDTWVVANSDRPDQPTFCGDVISDNSARIDYVIVPDSWKVNSAEIVFDKIRVSDHMGIFCEVDM
ncbi:endonuclease/exonuclease/phosphatase family protein [Fervidobacterium sp.]